MDRVTRENLKLVRTFLDEEGDVRGFTADTDYTYGRAYVALVEYVGKPFHLMSESDLKRFISRPTEIRRQGKPAGSPPAPSTKRRRASEVRELFKWLTKQGHVPRNVAEDIAVPTVDNEQPNPIGTELWCELWASDLLTDNDRVAFGLGMFCGFRRQEMTRFERRSVRGGELVDFWRKGEKVGATKHKGHSPWLSNVRLFMEHAPHMIGGDIATFTEPFERAYTRRRSGLLLDGWLEELSRRPTRSSESFIRPALVRDRLLFAVRNLGHDESEASPHMLRHGFISFLVNDAAMPIHKARVLAAHRSIATTQRYAKVNLDPGADYRSHSDDDDEIIARFSRRVG